MIFPPAGRILAILIGVYLIHKTIVLVRRRRENLFEFLLWSSLGLALIIFSLFPSLTDYLSELLGTSKGTNAIFLLAILILFFISFFVFKTTRNLHHNVSKLNEEISVLKSALKKADRKRKK